MRSSRLEPGKTDGRWIAIGCLSVYFVLLFVAHWRADYRSVWNDLGVPAMSPLFVDMHGIIASAESERAGYDPYVNNPYDPYQRLVNYPRIWYQVFYLLNLDQGSSVVVGVVLALIFYACALRFAGRISLWEGVAWSFFLCAPPVMMAVERGNNDLVIFILLAIALQIRRTLDSRTTFASYSLVGACACLKLFPFVAFCLALRERVRLAWTVVLLSTLGFATYLYVIREQVKAIRAILPHPAIYAFGLSVFADHCNASHPGSISPLWPVGAMLVVLVLACAGRGLAPRMPVMPRLKVEGLMVGSVLYVSSFALNSNTNYRLVFLLFTVPALLCLSREAGLYGQVGRGLLGALVVGWLLSSQWATAVFATKEICNWLVFAGMAFLWLECVEFLPLFGRGERAVQTALV